MSIINTTTAKLARGLAVSGSALVAAFAFSPVVSAQASTTPAATAQTYQVNLSPLNSSGMSGSATLTLTGNSLRVNMRATGASANLAHPMHIHVGQAVCPTPAADTDKDKYVSAKEADAVTGPIKVSLTTSGDTGTGSALATDRMPKADSKGNLTYDRTFTLPSGITAADMSKATIDVHGISILFDDKAKYDGSKKSDLDNKLAFEATVPAACGVITAAPTGGAATGAGSLKGIESPTLFAIGAAALASAIALSIVARKQLSAK